MKKEQDKAAPQEPRLHNGPVHFLVMRKQEKFLLCDKPGWSVFLQVGDVIVDYHMPPTIIHPHIPYRPSKLAIHIEED